MSDQDLAVRVYRLESLAIRTLALACGLATILGLVMTLWSEDDAELRLVTVPVEAFADKGGLAIVFGIGFSGLLIVQLGCLWMCLRACGRNGTERALTVARWFVGLSTVGSLVPVAFSGIAATSDEPGVSGAYGVIPLVIGVVLALLLVAPESISRIWVRHPAEPAMPDDDSP